VLERSQKRSRIGLEAGALEEYRLVGIIWGIQHPRAMIEDKAGIGYNLERGMTVGVEGGRVREIQKDRVVIIEERAASLQALVRPREVVLALPKP
jgi:Tfp pilus assembly protein PilP